MKTYTYTNTVVQDQRIEQSAYLMCRWLKPILLCLVLTIRSTGETAPPQAGASGGNAPAPGQAPSALKILDIQFEPIRSGKNVVYVKVLNPTQEERTLFVSIQTENKWGWGHDFPEQIKPGTERWARFAFKIFGSPTNEGNARLYFFDGAQAREADGSFDYRKFSFATLQKKQADLEGAQPVLAAVRDSVIQAFEDLRRDMRERDYAKVRARFTQDMLDAEFLQQSPAEFARRIDLPNPSSWCRGEFLALKPLSVARRDGLFELEADLAGEAWSIGFLHCDGLWKIDRLEGFTPSRGTTVLIKRLLPLLRKRSTDHIDIHYFPGSKAEADINQIAREREAGVQAVNDLLGTATSERLCLVFFDDLDTKARVTSHRGEGVADGYTIVEVYNDQVKLNPYHEATHALASEIGRPPAALLEGLAEYVSEKLGAAPLKDVGGGQATLYGFVCESREKGRWIPLSELLAYTNIGSQGRERNLLAYAESGAFTKFLIEAQGKEKFLEAYRRLRNGSDKAVQERNAEKVQEIYGTSLWALEGPWIEALSAGASRAAQAPPAAETNAVKVYPVNRKVADLPDKEDMSTPEAAYATLNRLLASGTLTFPRRFHVPWSSSQTSEPPEKREIPADERARFLGAEILEVQLWQKTNATVFAQTPTDVDLRLLCHVDGQWLNDGNDGGPTLDGARTRSTQIRAYKHARSLRNSRLPIADPGRYLRPFVEFLEREATDPQEFLLQALAKHRVVILGEVHNRQRYWAFNAALVRSPVFAKHVGVIYLELPSNDQSLMDRFLAAPKCDPAPVIDVLRDMHEFGWPDQPTLEFCQAVWEVNQSLPRAQRLRIVLADIARSWKSIHSRADVAKHFNVDRDEFMGSQIERDLRDHAQDPRHALFIVGCMHAPKNITRPGGEPFKSAGWHLCQGLGRTNVFAILPHSPVMSDHHDVDGRPALGLFETAFAARSNRPVAFPLDRGPFGELLFDRSLDLTTADPSRAGFDAYLYLGPLEDEVVSPLIPGFYTDEYAREVDRRTRVMDGHGLESIPGIGEVSGEAIRRLRAAWWGQPRYEWRRLGPLDAWHHGSGWKQRSRDAAYDTVRKDTTVIRREAGLLFDALRQADYSQAHNWQTFPSPNVGLYCVQTRRDDWTQWICQHFRTNPIVQVELGEVFFQAGGRPAVPYKLMLKDRTHLEGVLPFDWSPDAGRWEGHQGLDWHLRKGRR
ncbi:MAG: hypothetical protein HZA90_17265 [Verrucomicrobia bacterium]|nr:hypothetical protein [Verrucomicrobiota bacterium]